MKIFSPRELEVVKYVLLELTTSTQGNQILPIQLADDSRAKAVCVQGILKLCSLYWVKCTSPRQFDGASQAMLIKHSARVCERFWGLFTAYDHFSRDELQKSMRSLEVCLRAQTNAFVQDCLENLPAENRLISRLQQNEIIPKLISVERLATYRYERIDQFIRHTYDFLQVKDRGDLADFTAYLQAALIMQDPVFRRQVVWDFLSGALATGKVEACLARFSQENSQHMATLQADVRRMFTQAEMTRDLLLRLPTTQIPFNAILDKLMNFAVYGLQANHQLDLKAFMRQQCLNALASLPEGAQQAILKALVEGFSRTQMLRAFLSLPQSQIHREPFEQWVFQDCTKYWLGIVDPDVLDDNVKIRLKRHSLAVCEQFSEPLEDLPVINDQVLPIYAARLPELIRRQTFAFIRDCFDLRRAHPCLSLLSTNARCLAELSPPQVLELTQHRAIELHQGFMEESYDYRMAGDPAAEVEWYHAYFIAADCFEGQGKAFRRRVLCDSLQYVMQSEDPTLMAGYFAHIKNSGDLKRYRTVLREFLKQDDFVENVLRWVATSPEKEGQPCAFSPDARALEKLMDFALDGRGKIYLSLKKREAILRFSNRVQNLTVLTPAQKESLSNYLRELGAQCGVLSSAIDNRLSGEGGAQAGVVANHTDDSRMHGFYLPSGEALPGLAAEARTKHRQKAQKRKQAQKEKAAGATSPYAQSLPRRKLFPGSHTRSTRSQIQYSPLKLLRKIEKQRNENVSCNLSL